MLLAFALFGCQHSVHQCLISASSARYSSHGFWGSSMLLTDRGHLFRVTVIPPFYSQSSTQSCHVSFHPDCRIRSMLQSGATVLSIRLSSLQLIAYFHRKAFFEWSHSFLARSVFRRWQTTLKDFFCCLRKVHHLTPRLGPCLCLVGQCR